MLSTTCPDLHHQSSFHIKQDDKFFSKLLSKENSTPNPSFRVYYGDVSGAVPFTWETRPGTPKHTLSDVSLLPPLTPPPAYSFQTPNRNTTKNPGSKLLNALLMRITSVRKKSHVPLSPSCSSSLSSSSWSSSSFSAGAMTTKSNFHGRRRFSSCGSSFDNGPPNEHQEISGGSSTSCFGLRRGRRSLSLREGNFADTTMKKTLLSIIGRGSD